MEMNFDNILIEDKYFSDNNFREQGISKAFFEMNKFRNNYSYSYLFFHDFYHLIESQFNKNKDIFSISLEAILNNDSESSLKFNIIFRNSNHSILNFKDDFSESLNDIFQYYIDHDKTKFPYKNKKLYIQKFISKFDIEIDKESSFEIYDYLFGYLNPNIYNKEDLVNCFEGKNKNIVYNILGKQINFPYLLLNYSDLQEFKKAHTVFQNNIIKYTDNSYLLMYQTLPFLLKNKNILNDNLSVILGNKEDPKSELIDEDEDTEDIDYKIYNQVLYKVPEPLDLNVNDNNVLLSFCSFRKEVPVLNTLHNLKSFHYDDLLFKENDDFLDRIKRIFKYNIKENIIDEYFVYCEKEKIMHNISNDDYIKNKKRL